MHAPPLYFDYAATAPLRKCARTAMLQVLDQADANPGSPHALGSEALERLDHARQMLASAILAPAQGIIFTGSATEANNLALSGFVDYHGGPIACTLAEHKAVLSVVQHCAKQGTVWRPLAVDAWGVVDLNDLDRALAEGVRLVSIMWVNNETGQLSPIAQIAERCRASGATLHVDASQALGKVPIDVTRLGIDLLTLSAHKFGGPKGVGALYIRPRPPLRLAAQILGGAQERGLRAGTQALHQIVAMAVAAKAAAEDCADESMRLQALRARLWQGLSEALNGLQLNTHLALSSSHILNFGVAGVDGESLLVGLPQLALSSGSACTSASLDPSHVLLAMGRTRQQAQSALRLSLGHASLDTDIDVAVQAIADEVLRLRRLAGTLCNTVNEH